MSSKHHFLLDFGLFALPYKGDSRPCTPFRFVRSCEISVIGDFNVFFFLFVQELRHLLSSPLISSSPAAAAEITKDIEAAVVLLSQSIGIRNISQPSSSSETQSSGTTSAATEFSLDGGHVGALLQTPKGKNLVGRSLKLLSPEHRSASSSNNFNRK